MVNAPCSCCLTPVFCWLSQIQLSLEIGGLFIGRPCLLIDVFQRHQGPRSNRWFTQQTDIDLEKTIGFPHLLVCLLQGNVQILAIRPWGKKNGSTARSERKNHRALLTWRKLQGNHVYIYIYTYTHIYLYIYIYSWIYIYICKKNMYADIHVCIYIHTYIYIYTYV